MNIVNFLQIDESIASSGQPDRNDFGQIAALGYKTIINLAMPTSDKAIADEGALVTRAGMNYVHIPVEWEAPARHQFEFFSSIMAAQGSQKTWVHCALNMRASSFIYLYRRSHLGVEKSVAQASLTKIWQPNEVWSGYIQDLDIA